MRASLMRLCAVVGVMAVLGTPVAEPPRHHPQLTNVEHLPPAVTRLIHTFDRKMNSMKTLLGNLLAAYLLASVAAAQLMTATQNISPTIFPANSISCSTVGFHNNNSYWREYDPATAGLMGPIFLRGVDVGVERATSAPGEQPVIVSIYSNASPGALDIPPPALTLLASETFYIADSGPTLQQLRFTTPWPAYTSSGSDSLVISLFTPDGFASRSSFTIGSNSSGQTGPGYLSASACSTLAPTDLAVLGFPSMHIILDVVVDRTTQTSARVGTNEDLVLLTGVDLAPPNGLGEKTASATAFDALEIRLFSPGSALSGMEYLVLFQLAPSGMGGSFVVVAPGTGPIWLTTTPGAVTGAYGNEPIAPLGIPGLLGAGDDRIVILQPAFAGLDLSLQGLSFASSLAANGIYASTQHHVITLL